MSVKIKVSFTENEELQNVLTMLNSTVKKCKVSKEKKGEHYNAYIELKSA